MDEPSQAYAIPFGKGALTFGVLLSLVQRVLVSPVGLLGGRAVGAMFRNNSISPALKLRDKCGVNAAVQQHKSARFENEAGRCWNEIVGARGVALFANANGEIAALKLLGDSERRADISAFTI